MYLWQALLVQQIAVSQALEAAGLATAFKSCMRIRARKA